MKANISTSTKTLREMKPGVPFQFLYLDLAQCVCVVASSDDSGTAKALWDSHKPDHLCVVVLACIAPEDSPGFFRCGVRLSLHAGTRVVVLEQVGPFEFREASAL